MTARPSWLIALCVASAAALVTVLALIAFSPTPPPACSDSYDPSCAVIYEEEG